MSSFTPRLTAPNRSNSYYYSNNVFYNSGYGMPNCTAYAWGRFYEILEQRPKLCTGNAGDWYPYNMKTNAYQYGREPQIGAVMCWSRPGGAGHVAIVEQINSDNSVVVSESAYRSWNFKVRTHTPPNYSNMLGSAYKFQGFIYNPATLGMNSAVNDFVQEAESHKGEDGTWTWSTSGLGRGQPWCAAFIVAVAKTVGVLYKVITRSFNAGDIVRRSIANNLGTWYPGPAQGKSVSPQPGDILSIRNNDRRYTDTYDADHVGIVRKVQGSKILSVEGNWSSKVSFVERSTSSGQVNGIYRPNWGNSSGTAIYQPLYETLNDRNDSILREVGYVSNNYQLSVLGSNIRISAVNYTTLLNSAWEAFRMENSNQGVILDKLDPTPRQIIQFMMNKGLNAAAGVGIIANIYYESGFRTDAVEYGYTVSNGGIGLCQWTNFPRTASTGRSTNMRKMVGSDWRTDLTGQLEYLYYELTGSYKRVWTYLQGVANNEAGARDAADYFVRHFEIPGNLEETARRRMDKASEYWNMIAPTLK